MSKRKSTFRKRLADWFRSLIPPRVEKTYRIRFVNVIHGRLTLSNYYPRYSLCFTEPLQTMNFEEFARWHAECIADFEEATGTKIYEREFARERYLTYAEITKGGGLDV